MLISYIRTLILYPILILCVRLMGKRQIGEMEPTEFVVTMLIANLASIPMQDSAISLASGIVPILTVLGMELILAVASMRWIPLRQLLCGRPVILIENGAIIQKNLSRTRITLDELTEHLREHNILDLSTVKYAILETNGQISCFQYPKFKPAPAKDTGIQMKDIHLPYTIISDGRLLAKNLELSGFSDAWLREQLRSRNCTLAQVFLLTVDAVGKVYFVKKEEAV